MSKTKQRLTSTDLHNALEMLTVSELKEWMLALINHLNVDVYYVYNDKHTNHDVVMEKRDE